MIKVKLTKNNNYYKRIIITGHANYDDFGKDIVCAAASSIFITTVNSILSFGLKWCFTAISVPPLALSIINFVFIISYFGKKWEYL